MKTTRRSDSPLYKRHYQFLTGCLDPNCRAWHNYGARGVKIHRPWATLKTGFDRFEDWVLANLGPIPFPGAVIRRINPNGDIKPGNLEWSTRKVVSNHRRTNCMIRIGRQKKSLGEWCSQYGKNPRTVWSRIFDRGWTPKDALEI